MDVKNARCHAGSLSMSRPGYHFHIHDAADYRKYCAELFDMVKSGVLKLETGGTYALKDAAQAHRDLEARKTAGSVVLLP